MTLQQMRYAIAVADAQSMNKASQELFISQPSLSGSIKELEHEIGITLFNRTNRGITVTAEGEEFLGYARQMCQQFALVENRYITKKNMKKKFSVSMQHYTFAVKAFVEMVREFGMDEYEFAVRETKTYEVMEDVRTCKSDLGILYMDDFNSKVVQKILNENQLIFHPLFQCKTYVYLWKGNPLADREVLTMEDLESYPCLSFDQGSNNSFYLAEEVLSTYDYKQIIKANDRATVLNLMVGLNGYTLCSGILCEELNGGDYIAVPLESEEIMTIGYITRKDQMLSDLSIKYIEELKLYENKLL
ncbi:methionine biosynthesis and transport regulator MtaR, LysR family [Lachnospiraceae bacterium KM106-2]|nr:methionine biosynthesis and transport regulator MtaR, LysR family [Lachnospiraceae bacterium KM106-2]